MKKMLFTVLMVLMSIIGSWAETRDDRGYVNLSFTVWKLENGPSEAARRINTPIPKVFSESWLCDFIAFDITEEKPAPRVLEKGGLRFVLTAEYKDRLTIQVYEKGKEAFRFIHKRPSTVDYIFYSSDGLTYLLELTYSTGNHLIGPLSPGILKKSISGDR